MSYLFTKRVNAVDRVNADMKYGILANEWVVRLG